jgi:hypothetical protein
MKVFVLDNHDSRFVIEGAMIDVVQSIRYELENMGKTAYGCDGQHTNFLNLWNRFNSCIS